MTKVFLSYRRGDSADVTGRIDDRLVSSFGRDNVFKDIDSIPLGVDFRVYLAEAVGECDVVLVVMGERWLGAHDEAGNRRLNDEADFVRIEVESALQRNIPVVPVLLGNAQMPNVEELPASMAELSFRNATKVRPDPDFGPDMSRIIEGITRANPGPAAASEDRGAARTQTAPAISVKCQCGQTLRAPAKMAGKSAACPSCGARVSIPSAGGSSPESPPSSAPQPKAAPSQAERPAGKPVAAKPLLIGVGSLIAVAVLVFALVRRGSPPENGKATSPAPPGTETEPGAPETKTVRPVPTDVPPAVFWSEVRWNALSEHEKGLFTKLGWEQELWESFWFDTDDIDPPVSWVKHWNDLTADERTACKLLGWNQPWWNLYLVELPSNDDFDWDNLNVEQQAIYESVGFGSAYFDGRQSNPLENTAWADLSAYERAALQQINSDYNEETWNRPTPE